MSNAIGIYIAQASFQKASEQLAEQFGLPIHTECPSALYLCLTDKGLCLVNPTQKTKPFYVDFLSEKMQARQAQLSRKNELLVRALGKTQDPLNIFDLTAGFGQDGFLMASLNHNVSLVEKNPVIAALLQDGIARLLKEKPHYQMQLIFDDSEVILTDTNKHIDLIYLDPMFPEKQKSALVKYPMQLLQRIVGEDDNTAVILQSAIKSAKQRVIVKRPKEAGYYQAMKPQFSLHNNTLRYDIYGAAGADSDG